MVSQENIKRAKEIAQTIVDAYGKDPAEYDAVEQQALSAFTFGTVYTYYFEEANATIPEFQAVMMKIFFDQFHYDLKELANYFDFLAHCTQEEYHPMMYTIIHKGIDGTDYLDEPGALGENLHKLIAILKGEIGP